MEGEKGKLNNSITLSIRPKLALVIITQRLSPTKVDNENTLIKKPSVPRMKPTLQLSHQFFCLNQDHPSQKANIPYGNKNKLPLIGPISINNKRNCIMSPSNAGFAPLRKCSKTIGRGNINLNNAPPTGK